MNLRLLTLQMFDRAMTQAWIPRLPQSHFGHSADKTELALVRVAVVVLRALAKIQKTSEPVNQSQDSKAFVAPVA